MDANELIPPTQYDPLWAVTSIGLFVLLGVFLTLLLVMTRKMKIEDDVQPLAKMAFGEERLSLIKTKYVNQILSVQKQHTEGKLSSRKAFQKLSICLRNFTHEYSQSGAFSMTLTDLKDNQAPPLLTDKINNFYPLAFEEANRTGNVDLAVNDALQVVQLWH